MKKQWDEILSPSHDNETLWELFHVNSRCSHFNVGNYPKDKIIKEKPSDAMIPYSHCPTIFLPDSNKNLDMSLVNAIRNRTSKENIARGQFSLTDISTLFLSSYTLKNGKSSRYAPSAGALYPIEIFFHLSINENQKSDMDSGLYYYNPIRKELRQLINKNCDAQVQNLLMQPNLVKNSTLQIFLTAVFERSTQKYGDRGYRFAFLEAGHIAQNINLVATAMSLASINVGGYYENEANKLLKFDGLTQSVIYMVLVGDQVNTI